MKKGWIEMALKFASRRLIASGFTAYEVCMDPALDLWQRCLMTALGLAFLWSQTYLDKKRLELGLPAEGDKPLLPPGAEAPKPAGGESGHGRIGTLLVVLFVVAAIAIVFAPKAEAGILEYIDPEIGSGWEFLYIKGPVVTGTARILAGKGKLDWLSLRGGGLLGDDAEPGLIGGPNIDLTKATRGKFDFLLGYVKADVGLFGGIIYDPGEEEKKVEGLFGVGVTLVSR